MSWMYINKDGVECPWDTTQRLPAGTQWQHAAFLNQFVDAINERLKLTWASRYGLINKIERGDSVQDHAIYKSFQDAILNLSGYIALRFFYNPMHPLGLYGDFIDPTHFDISAVDITDFRDSFSNEFSFPCKQLMFSRGNSYVSAFTGDCAKHICNAAKIDGVQRKYYEDGRIKEVTSYDYSEWVIRRGDIIGLWIFEDLAKMISSYRLILHVPVDSYVFSSNPLFLDRNDYSFYATSDVSVNDAMLTAVEMYSNVSAEEQNVSSQMLLSVLAYGRSFEGGQTHFAQLDKVFCSGVLNPNIDQETSYYINTLHDATSQAGEGTALGLELNKIYFYGKSSERIFIPSFCAKLPNPYEMLGSKQGQFEIDMAFTTCDLRSSLEYP